ncbi:hypothetical protein VCSRO163_2509 [Vibrio cholerae]|nr:hypothetical protein VCSRO163_2509 [Vibrio cholerae]
MSYCRARMSDETMAAFDEFQRELGTDYLSNPEYAMRLARSYIDKHPVFHFIDGIGTPLYVNNECAERIAALQKPKHGGKRKGAGRKKQEPTVLVRVPQSIADLLIEFKSDYARLDNESKDLIRENLMALVKNLPVQE